MGRFKGYHQTGVLSLGRDENRLWGNAHKNEQGLATAYHGVFETMGGAVYRLGAALCDLDDPSRVLGVADDWILQPEDPWEVTGYVHNVVFCCGAVQEEDGSIKIYWGGAGWRRNLVLRGSQI